VVKVGLTGGIGAGKSAVGALLAKHGAMVIDADQVAREVVAPGTAGLTRVVAEFGLRVLGPDGALDRRRLADLVFADPDARTRLNGIVHPLVGARTAELTAAAAPGTVVVHDVPLLVENGLAPAYDLVLVVEATEPTRVRRLVEHRGMTEAAARARIAAQASDAQRRAVADVVLGNNGDLAELAGKVAAAWRDRVAPLLAAKGSSG
jgi:dephospho-CoA kinase